MNREQVALLIQKARDYKKEYQNYHGKPEQIKNRASRNAARRKLAKEGRVEPGDGRDVDHIDHDPMNNDDKNLRARNMNHNRADNKHKAYRAAAALMAQVERAGARHSSRDNGLIQQLHDLACELGATCQENEGEVSPVLRAAVEALVLRHPGHGNQKVHGNRFGAGQAKESFRRLKDDKGARERYKTEARKRGSLQNIGKKAEGAKSWEDVKKIPGIQAAFDKAEGRLDAIDQEIAKFSSGYAQSDAGKKNYDKLIREKVELHRGVKKLYDVAKRYKGKDAPHSKYGLSTGYRLSTGERLDV